MANKFYDIPTQVMFLEEIQYDSRVDFDVKDVNWTAGIAYQDGVICSCCGSIIPMEDILHIIEMPWVDFQEAIEYYGGGDPEIDNEMDEAAGKWYDNFFGKEYENDKIAKKEKFYEKDGDAR